MPLFYEIMRLHASKFAGKSVNCRLQLRNFRISLYFVYKLFTTNRPKSGILGAQGSCFTEIFVESQQQPFK